MYRTIYKNMRLIAAFTLITTALLTLIACYTQFNGRLQQEIQMEAQLIASGANQAGEDMAYLSGLQMSMGEKRITLIAPDGQVVFDNGANVADLDNHGSRPEVMEARRNGSAEAKRTSVTMGAAVYYYAVLLESGNVLRIAGPTNNVFKLLLQVLPYVLLIAFVIYILATIIALKLTEQITRPINQIDLDRPTDEATYEELAPFFKRMEQQRREIRRQMDKLRAQTSKLNAISETMSEGLVVLDKQGIVLSVNDSALAIFRAERQDVERLSYLHLTRDLELAGHVRNALEGKGDTARFCAGSSTYQVFYSPVWDRQQVSGAILLLFDITQREQAEQMRREFSANVSHELKTPLTTILGYSQMIHNGMAKEEDIASFTAKIEQEAERLIALVEDIIKLSRLDEQAEGGEDRQQVALSDVARSAVERLEEPIRRNNLSVTVEGEDFTVFGNPAQLSELVYNLCDNAVKYNREGGRIDVTLRGRTLTVADTGIGIPPEHQQRVFERFYRVDKSRSKQVSGTGLGLSIVKHIAQRYGAVLTLNSTVGEGTSISVTFPAENGRN